MQSQIIKKRLSTQQTPNDQSSIQIYLITFGTSAALAFFKYGHTSSLPTSCSLSISINTDKLYADLGSFFSYPNS